MKDFEKGNLKPGKVAGEEADVRDETVESWHERAREIRNNSRFTAVFPAYAGFAVGSTQQPLPPLPIRRIFPFQPAVSHVPFHHLAPCHSRPSPSSLTFNLKRHDLFHPIIIILPQTISQLS